MMRKLDGWKLLTISLLIFIGLGALGGARSFFAPRGVYVIPVTIGVDSLHSTAARIGAATWLGLIYPDTSSMVVTHFAFDVSRDESTWYTLLDTTGTEIMIGNNEETGGYVNLSDWGIMGGPQFLRIRLAVGDTAKAIKTFYFTFREGG